MKKFYPEEYFRRTGYEFKPYNTQKVPKDFVQLKPKQPKIQTEFNRFNEELVYPNTQEKISVLSRTEKRSQADVKSVKSKVSRTSSAMSRLSKSKVMSRLGSRHSK